MIFCPNTPEDIGQNNRINYQHSYITDHTKLTKYNSSYRVDKFIKISQIFLDKHLIFLQYSVIIIVTETIIAFDTERKGGII